MTTTSTPPTWETIRLIPGISRKAWMTGIPAESVRKTGTELGLAAPRTTLSWWARILGRSLKQFEILVSVENGAITIGPLEIRRTRLTPDSTIILARDADTERTIRLARITAISPGSCNEGRCAMLLECEWYRGRTTDNTADYLLIRAAPPSDTAEYWQSRTTS